MPVLSRIDHLWMAEKSRGGGFLLRPYTAAFLEVLLPLRGDQTPLVHPPNPYEVFVYARDE